jgi:hypothetical protein
MYEKTDFINFNVVYQEKFQFVDLMGGVCVKIH